jgi:hypothetical protein
LRKAVLAKLLGRAGALESTLRVAHPRFAHHTSTTPSDSTENETLSRTADHASGWRIGEIIARRRAARALQTDAGVMLSEFIFHREGLPIGDIRKAWRTACRLPGYPATCSMTCAAPSRTMRTMSKPCASPRASRFFSDFDRSGHSDMADNFHSSSSSEGDIIIKFQQ